jgi:hypothetical protein
MMIKPRFPYETLAMHIFKYPDREMCLAEWDKIFCSAPYYHTGRKQIEGFFNSVINSEINRLSN